MNVWSSCFYLAFSIYFCLKTKSYDRFSYAEGFRSLYLNFTYNFFHSWKNL